MSGDADREVVCQSKAFRKFLGCFSGREAPVLVDLGQAVGSNIYTLLGERHGCKIFVEDLFADLERQKSSDALPELPAFFEHRFSQPNASVDGILLWNLFDYLERQAAVSLARQLTRMLRPGGALLGYFRTTDRASRNYTRCTVIDDLTLRFRSYPGSVERQPVFLNREIIKMFDGLLVSDSFLLKTATLEVLFRKPAKPAHLGASRTPI